MKVVFWVRLCCSIFWKRNDTSSSTVSPELRWLTSETNAFVSVTR